MSSRVLLVFVACVAFWVLAEDASDIEVISVDGEQLVKEFDNDQTMENFIDRNDDLEEAEQRRYVLFRRSADGIAGL